MKRVIERRPMTLRRWLPWIVLVAMVTLNVIVRLRLAPAPLERDEGEYAYAGQLLLRGIPPYIHAYNMKFPGTYVAYAGMMAIFGQTIVGIHRGMAVVTSVNIVLLFLLARRFWANAAAVPSVVLYTLLQLDLYSLSFHGHATHFVVLAGLAGLVLQPDDRSAPRHRLRCFLAGVCFGLAVLAKQPGAAFGLIGEAWLLITWWRQKWPVYDWLRSAVSMAMGGMLPVVLTVVWLWRAGALAAAKFWTIDYARAYGSEATLRMGIGLFRLEFGRLIQNSHWLWAIGAAGIVVTAMIGHQRRRSIQLVVLTVLAGAAVSAGLYFRPHYFIMLFPALALGVGGLHAAVHQQFRRQRWLVRVFALLWIAACAEFVITQSFVWFVMDPSELCVREYNDALFNSAVDVGHYLADHSDPSDTVAVFGSEPEVYFYAHRLSASGYIYTYPLVENQPFADQMQHEMARQIESAKPKFLVTVTNTHSWGPVLASRLWIFDWWKQFAAQYEPVAVMVEPPADSTTPAADVQSLTIFRRIAGR